MAEGRSPFPDDEVFFGKKRTVKELAKSVQYGQNFYSPATTRGGRLNSTDTPTTLASTLPDVLNGSTRATETHCSNSDILNTSQISGLNGTSSVIDLDSDQDSGFLLNEKQVTEPAEAFESM